MDLTPTKDQRVWLDKMLARWKREKESCKALASQYRYNKELKTQYESSARTLERCIKDVEEIFSL